MGDERLSLASAAEACGLSVDVLYGLIVRGQVKAERDERTRLLVVPRDEVLRLLGLGDAADE